ncbi:glutathione-disulfide reductase [Rhodospirillaceae bacterium SYSU D60014]|uniref:glutathione-disulfide reductase n=1 Tax=Virgifigura deserti TaxID=2268457 RepID=UPI000E6670F6
MSKYDYDLFVIGAGSGGVRAARMASAYGARVAIAEESRVGGTCVIRGCIPKKLLVYASHFHEDFVDAAGYGWAVPEPTFDWPTLIANKDREIDRLNDIYKKLLADASVTLIEERATVVDPHSVEVCGRRITAETILVAVGGWPTMPREPGAEYGITSNEVFHLPEFPRRVIVAGGGYIAVEFAGIFNGLGAEVVQLYRGEQILRGFDDDIRTSVAAEMGKKGVDIRLHTIILETEKVCDTYRATLSDGSVLEADCILYAIGRKPKTAGLGLEEAGVKLDGEGAVIVNKFSGSSVPSIYAIGDCTNRVNLTPVAIKEGAAFADTLYGERPWAMDHDCIASAVFSQPPVGTVGLSEAEARRRFGAVDIYKSTFRPLRHTLTGSEEKAMMKLVVDRESQRVLGAHMVGADAPEIIQGIAIAVKMGATKAQFDQTVAIHPSAAEEFVLMRTKQPDPVAEAAE